MNNIHIYSAAGANKTQMYTQPFDFYGFFKCLHMLAQLGVKRSDFPILMGPPDSIIEQATRKSQNKFAALKAAWGHRDSATESTARTSLKPGLRAMTGVSK